MSNYFNKISVCLCENGDSKAELESCYINKLLSWVVGSMIWEALRVGRWSPLSI
jgi:hypothetical protein